MSTRRFDTKDPLEKVKLTFDFTVDLPTGVTLSGTPTVAITLDRGNDPAPSSIANGSAGLDATLKKAIVPVQAGVEANDYRISVVCSTTDPKIVLELDGVLPIRS